MSTPNVVSAVQVEDRPPIELTRLTTGEVRGRILVIHEANDAGQRIADLLTRAGFEVRTCGLDRAVEQLHHLKHNLVIASDRGIFALDHLRSDPAFDSLPFLVHSDNRNPEHIADMLGRGADDFLASNAGETELLARINANLTRSEMGRLLDDGPLVDAVTLESQLERELHRAGTGDSGVIAIAVFADLEATTLEGGPVRRQALTYVAEHLQATAAPMDLIGLTRYGDIAVLMPRTSADEGAERLMAMAEAAATVRLVIEGTVVDMTARIGYTPFDAADPLSPLEAFSRASRAAIEAVAENDGGPRRFEANAGQERLVRGSQQVQTAEKTEDRVLVIDDDLFVRRLLKAAFEREGLKVTDADGASALSALLENTYDAVVVDRSMPVMGGDEILRRVRSDPSFDTTPVLFLTATSDVTEVVAALESGADDYIVKPFVVPEVTARVRARVKQSRMVRQQAEHTVVTSDRFAFELARELKRVRLGGSGAALAMIEVPSLDAVAQGLGPRQRRAALEELAAAMQSVRQPLDILGATPSGDLAILLPDVTAREAGERLTAMAAAAAGVVTQVARQTIRPVPLIGFVHVEPGESIEAEAAYMRASMAATQAASTMDLQPRLYLPPEIIAPKGTNDHHPVREVAQVVITTLLGVVMPFFLYMAFDALGFDITWGVYLTVVVALVTTGGLIWTEGFLSGRDFDPPEEPGRPPPLASAIICAYLPNEADTIVDTLRAFLRVDYEPGLQIVLAYNTPQPLPVEAEIHQLAAEHPNLLALKVRHSNSKAQNLNHALGRVTGEFVGVFDADHQPDPDSFHRAWRWLSNGYDAVQGHCLVRNGDQTFMARMVAVEFESIYAVSHPGRYLRDGFGVFGGSNGYWLTEQLHLIRMRGSMLTEDIDSSMRLLESGGRIGSDPHLISRELATTTPRQVWNQRLRWAQGWFQVSVRHLMEMLRNDRFTFRQKFGIFNLLLQREVYPWISLQILPLIAYWTWRGDVLDYFVPIFVATTIFTTSVGPGQVVFAYRRAHPDIRRHRWWFVQYFLFSILLYTEAKNVIARVAHLKQAMGESSWRVTPRSVHPGS